MTLSLALIMLVVLALILGPVTMLIPKPEQRAREQLRLRARQLGLHFTLRRLPAQKTDMEQRQPMECYSLAPTKQSGSVIEWTLMRTSYAHEGNFYREWDWAGENKPNPDVMRLLERQVPHLPESVKALGVDRSGVHIFWTEKEGDGFLDSLVNLLREIQQAGD